MGAVEVAVEVAERSAGESGGLAAAAVGFDVTADGVLGIFGVHWFPFGLKAKGPHVKCSPSF